MRYYREVGGRDYQTPINIYRDDRMGTVERREGTRWVEVDRGWFYDRLDNGDPTLDRIITEEVGRFDLYSSWNTNPATKERD